jgi:hypothetical protein
MRHRGIYLAAAVFLAASTGWVGLNLLRGDDDTDGQLQQVPIVADEAAPGEVASVGADDVDDALRAVGGAGSGSGGVRGVAGARAAALGWVSALGRLIELGPIATAELLGEVLTEEAAAETVEGFRRERELFVERFGVDPSRALWIDSPLTVEVAELSPERAVVLVWSQLITGSVNASAVDVVYRTHTVTLLWERNGWRVAEVSRRHGPTPTVAAGELPSPGEEFATVATWTPAVLAGVAGEE